MARRKSTLRNAGHNTREFVRMPDRCSGQINSHYDRAENSQDRTNQRGTDLGLRHRPRHNARALSCLQPVAGLARQVGSASLRPHRDLFIDQVSTSPSG